MFNFIGIMAAAGIVFLFYSGAAYYYYLIKFMNFIKSNNPDVWTNAHDPSKYRGGDLNVAYRLLLTIGKGNGGFNLGIAGLYLVKSAKKWLFISISLSMIFLVVGLSISVNK